MDDVINIQTISQYNNLKGIATRHPLITVFGGVNSPSKALPNGKLNFGLYGVFLKRDPNCELYYGRNKYDFEEGTMIFLAPNQVLTVDHPSGYPAKGHFLVFHPDFIKGTAIVNLMSRYSFFSYEMNEALHMSESEKKIIADLFKKIDYELEQSIDKHSKAIIINNIETLLNYCLRFYDRQFITREHLNLGVIGKFEGLLIDYFQTGKPLELGIPSVSYFADELNLSANYFGDLIKKETGKSAREHIHLKLIDIAKERLFVSEKNINEIAYELGFKYPNHFSRLFKKEVGMTPREFKALN